MSEHAWECDNFLGRSGLNCLDTGVTSRCGPCSAVATRLAAARDAGAQEVRAKIEAAIDACATCGKPHVLRELHHPGELHDHRAHRHSGGCTTLADPVDGHPYLRPDARAAVRALLADGGEPQ